MNTSWKLLFLVGLICPFISYGQDYSDRTIIGEQNAIQSVKAALRDKNYKPSYGVLIKDKEIAIAVAEPILFKIYGKKNITEERPYESYLVDGYWYISGTLPKNSLGGVFEIIINSRDGQVIKIIHGK